MELTPQEEATKVIDELIVLFCLRETDMQYNVIRDGLEMIARSRRANSSYPITVSLYQYMVKNGYLNEGE